MREIKLSGREVVVIRSIGFAVGVSGQDLLEANAVVGEPTGTPRVVLHPGASDTRRRWPTTRFAEVGDGSA